MKFLFYFVHPSKYHLFKHTINALKAEGHIIDIAITTKDVLEDLIRNEGWQYTNIFPEGRKIKGLPRLAGVGINFFRSVYRLLKYVGPRKYDLIVTDDVGVVVGRIKSVPSIMFLDNDLSTAPAIRPLLLFANKILSPESTNLGEFARKKIAFKGYKELAYLHPNYFSASSQIVSEFNPARGKYFLIRLVSNTALHDINKRGLGDRDLKEIINKLENYGRVFISSESPLAPEFARYRINIVPNDIAHALYFSELFIGDSGTMTAEAALLGVPSIFFHDFAGKQSCTEEKQHKYNLLYSFNPDQLHDMLRKIDELLNMPRLREEWQQRRQKMLDDTIDVTKFMVWLFGNFPQSVSILQENPDYQYIFK